MNHFLSTVFTIGLLGPLAICSVSADPNLENWPQWRGPTGNGVVSEGDPPVEWSEDKNVLWKVEIAGQGHATPIIWGKQLFVVAAVAEEAVGDPVTSASENPPAGPVARDAAANDVPPRGGGGGGNPPGRGRGGRGGFGGGPAPSVDYSFNVLCLDRETGRPLWESVARRVRPHQGIQRSNTYASASPVTDGEHLYVSFGSQGLHCFDLGGQKIWERDLGKVSVTFGEASSPALAGDVLIVVQDSNGDSFVYGLDKKTGKELWRRARDEGSGWTTPYVLQRDGRTEAIVNGSNAVVSYDPKTGETLWQCSGLGSNPVPMIVSDSDTVYAMSGHRNGAGLAIRLGQSGDLTGTDAVRWRIDRGTPYVPSPLLYGGLLFFCQRTSAILTCLDPATGEAHYEQQRIDAVSGVYSSPIGVQNRIYWAGQNGTTLVLECGKDLKVLASNALDDGFDASPAVVGDQLFLRGRKHLYCIAAN